MDKRLAVLALVLLLALPGAASAHESGKLIYLPIGQQQVTVNGVASSLDVPAQILADRTMVPVRFVSETIGAEVGWDNTDRKVTITMGSRMVEAWVDKSEAKVNGQAVALDVPPRIVSDRTLVPLRFVSENLGLVVGWDNANRAVYVVSGHADSVVLVRQFSFEWSPVPLKAGTTLVVINLDSARHTFTDTKLRFDSGALSKGWAYTATLDQAGAYTLFCDFHPSMELKLTVQP